MNDLQHPNEYIRGSTLRFLCKIKEAEILEPLVPSVRACLVKKKKRNTPFLTLHIHIVTIRNTVILMLERMLYLQLVLFSCLLTISSLTPLKLFSPFCLL